MDFPASDMSHSRRSFEFQVFFLWRVGKSISICFNVLKRSLSSNVQTQFGQPSDVEYFVEKTCVWDDIIFSSLGNPSCYQRKAGNSWTDCNI